MQTKKLLSSINEFARLASNRSELVGACFVLVIIVMMVIPLSPVLLDILIAVNISATIVLVVSAMLLETPLKFSSFPAILLMTTLFRLALTISTTRQILLEADAGHIIQTFGEFVIGGNVTVGLIMFLILAIVNFLVVTKGSERVAEVADVTRKSNAHLEQTLIRHLREPVEEMTRKIESRINSTKVSNADIASKIVRASNGSGSANHVAVSRQEQS